MASDGLRATTRPPEVFQDWMTLKDAKWWMTRNGTADIICSRPFRIQLQSTVLRALGNSSSGTQNFGKCLNLRLRCRRSERGIFNSSAAVCACRSENVCTWYGQVQPHTQQLHFMLRHTSSAYFCFCGISTQQNSIIFNFDRFQPDNSGKNLQRGKLSTVVPI